MSGTNIGAFENPRGLADRKRILRPGLTSSRVFYSAVVIDYISNPDSELAATAVIGEDDASIDYRQSLKTGVNSVGNPDLVDVMPRNSIVARIVSDKASRISSPEIFYPFFSPHLCMPVKAAEQVWIIFEKAGSKKATGYWMCRRPSDLQVDDLNYTHEDRVTLDLYESGTDQSAESNEEGSDVDPFSFPLGGKGNRQFNTLPGEYPFKDIIDSSQSYQAEFLGEPVPRFSKRSTDLALQGSHNTLVSLGRDRVGAEQYAEGEEDPDQKELAGSIDIVTGRGLKWDAGESAAVVNTPTAATEPNGEAGGPETVDGEANVKNRGYEEIDKAPTISGNTSNVNEGDPDFVNDLSRVYVSMKTNGDENFGISGITELGSVDVADRAAEPFIVMKSTNTRIISRPDGSVKIVKMGPDDSNAEAASIVLDKDGNIQIQTNGEITLCKTGDTASEGNTTGIQPFVRGDDLADVLQAFMEQTAALFNDIADTWTSLGATDLSSNVTPGYGSPNPAVTAAAGTFSSAAADLMIGANEITTGGGDAMVADLAKFKSTVIKGE